MVIGNEHSKRLAAPYNPAVAASVVFLYVTGAAMIALGIRIISRQAFPGWMKGVWVWPLERITPRVAVFNGWAAVLVGAAAIAATFATYVTAINTSVVFALALICAAASLLLVAYSTWLSRRPEPGAMPPGP